MILIYALQLPEEARELEKELRQITKEKNEAVRGQDFEKVFYCLTVPVFFLLTCGNFNPFTYEYAGLDYALS